MGRKSEERIQAAQILGCKYFKLIPELLERLHGQATERDKAGNREFFCDHYVSLLLLYFFSPVVIEGRPDSCGYDVSADGIISTNRLATESFLRNGDLKTTAATAHVDGC